VSAGALAQAGHLTSRVDTLSLSTGWQANSRPFAPKRHKNRKVSVGFYQVLPLYSEAMRRARIPGFVRHLAVAAAVTLAAAASIAGARAQDATAQPAAFQPPTTSIAETYKLGTGDKLRVIVYGEDDLGGTFDVDGNGFISLPLIGQVKVSGLSATQVERAITLKFSDGYLKEPRVNVEVTQYRPFYVLGEVNRPGSYPYTDGMSVQNAVADAGGYTQKAVEDGVYVRHAGDTKEVYLSADSPEQIYPGDVVRVPSSLFWDTISVLGPLAGFAALYGAYHN